MIKLSQVRNETEFALMVFPFFFNLQDYTETFFQWYMIQEFHKNSSFNNIL